MAEREAAHNRNFQRYQPFFKDVAERLSIFFGGLPFRVFAPAVDPDGDTGNFL
jgi:hypothetical protein